MTVQDLSDRTQIPAFRRALCSSCGEPVDIAARSTFQRVSGWIQNKASHLVLSERSPVWICRPCVDRLKVGAPINQGSLFDERD